MKESQSITAEEILNTLLLFFIKKPKGLLILGIIVAFMVSFMYVSYIRSQNEILISSLSVLKDMSVIVDNAQKRSNQIEKTTNALNCISRRFCKALCIAERSRGFR